MTSCHEMDLQVKDVHGENTREPAVEIIGRVSEELCHVADEVGQLQLLLSDLLLESTLKPEFLRDVQSVDHVEQKLRALSQFVQALSSQMDVGWCLDATTAAEGITLSDLARRLQKPGLLADETEASGDFELF